MNISERLLDRWVINYETRRDPQIDSGVLVGSLFRPPRNHTARGDSQGKATEEGDRLTSPRALLREVERRGRNRKHKAMLCLAGPGHRNRPPIKLGTIDTLFLYVFMQYGRVIQKDGASWLSVGEGKFVETLIDWDRKDFVKFGGADLERKGDRISKYWILFRNKFRGLVGEPEPGPDGQKSYTIRLRREQLQDGLRRVSPPPKRR